MIIMFLADHPKFANLAAMKKKRPTGNCIAKNQQKIEKLRKKAAKETGLDALLDEENDDNPSEAPTGSDEDSAQPAKKQPSFGETAITALERVQGAMSSLLKSAIDEA